MYAATKRKEGKTKKEKRGLSLPLATMALFPKGWTNSRVCYLASRIYFILIVFQIPLFRIPCRSGMCTTPIQVTSSQLIANEVFPLAVVKALLYPGAIANGLFTNMTIPRWDSLLQTYNLTGAKKASAIVDLQRLEVLVGSYFAVAGGLAGLIAPGRMSMFGTLLIVWGLVKEGIFGKSVNPDPAAKAIYVYPTMLIALICAVSSVKHKKKQQQEAPTSQARPIGKPLPSSAKSKLR